MLAVAVILLIFYGCHPGDADTLQPGKIIFSFKKQELVTPGGKVKDAVTPAFASYTLKKPDGSTISAKIELTAFNGSFVTSPQQFSVGQYSLEQFLILDSDGNTIYAAPIAGTAMSALVEHPLPLSFDVTVDNVTNVTPEVLDIEDHTAEDFGYATFGFVVVKEYTFTTTASIADNDQHSAVDYTLEIVAKDQALGTVKWTKTVNLSAAGTIQVPAKYGHYTFKATKTDYLPHEQHFLADELSGLSSLAFEFIPESLDGFIVREVDGMKAYFPNQDNRCKLYARVDIPEGYRVGYLYVDKSASSPSSVPISDVSFLECYHDLGGVWTASTCGNNVNVFHNIPFSKAEDFCTHIDLSATTYVQTTDDALLESTIFAGHYNPGDAESTEYPILSLYQAWQPIHP